ncbi:MAG TPA: alkaline phosphatase family protein [Nitrososphaerales archaeon]|nr:alkaline phosphatase family protein [Nitrososphaerales archaeon]
MRASRALGLLSGILLVAAALTGALPVASAVGLRVSVGQISVSGCCSASVPLTLTNGGFLALNGLKIQATLLDSSGSAIGSGTSNTVDVPVGSATPLTVTVSSSGGASLASTSKVQVQAMTNIGGLLPVTTFLSVPIQLSGGGPAPVAQTPIEHVVVVMMENHAFDNIFGVYPTANGTVSSPLASQIQTPDNLLGTNAPKGIVALAPGTFSTPDIPHDTASETAAWDNGAMDGFVSHMGSNSLTYFTNSQLAGEWNLAEQYGLGDSYFQSVLGPTIPNRVMALTGSPADPSLADASSINSSAVTAVALKSVFAELTSSQLSWGYYSEGGAGALASLAQSSQVPFPPGSLGSVNDFYNSLSNGSMHAVSWLDPFSWTSEANGQNIQFSQHPPYNVTQGEQWMLGIVNHVENSRFWNSSAIFITYDESGGYYDHVAPPKLDGNQLGFRVPLIVVSPYAKEGYVSHTVLTHSSLLAFIDYNWKLKGLSQLVLDSNLPLDFFDFDSARSANPIDPAAAFPMSPQTPYASLGYQRTGSSSQTLSQMGVGLWNGVP